MPHLANRTNVTGLLRRVASGAPNGGARHRRLEIRSYLAPLAVFDDRGQHADHWWRWERAVNDRM